MTSERPSWGDLWMAAADMISSRGSCLRQKSGCVLIDPVTNRQLASGYNGSPPGAPSCLMVGCQMFEGHCVRTIHAEANAVLHAARYGVPLVDSVAFVTHRPCIRCATLLLGAGIRGVNYLHDYPWPDRALVTELFASMNKPFIYWDRGYTRPPTSVV